MLSSAFLAASLAFIKDVVHIDEAIHLYYLDLSFIVLALCIFLVLFSYQYSIHCQIRAKEYWDTKAQGDLDVQFPYHLTGFIKVVNRLAGLLFALGVALTVFFVISNLNNEANMSKLRGTANDGLFVKAPLKGNTHPGDYEKGSHVKTPPTPAPAEPSKPAPGTGSEQPKKP